MRILAGLSIIGFVVAGSVLAADPPPPLPNLDLQSVPVGDPPPGWRQNGSNPKAVKLTTVQDPEGGFGKAVLLTVQPGPGPSPFGGMMQTTSAATFRGAVARLQVKLRLDKSDPAKASLWIRADGPLHKPLVFRTSQEAKGDGWAVYDVDLVVPPDADGLYFGGRILGSGKAWFSDASLVVVSPAELGWRPPKALTARGQRNLIAFARLYGDVRFFHPSDEAVAADWRRIAVESVERVEAAPNAKALASALQAVFAPVAPTLRVFSTDAPVAQPSPALAQRSGAQLVHWVHRGVKLDGQDPVYSSRREQTAGAAPEIYRADLGGGVGALVPVSLYLPSQAPADLASAAPNASRPSRMYSGDDRSTRLGDVVIAWAALAHFYPYADITRTDWNGELSRALERAAEDRDETGFQETLDLLVAALKDGHGNVEHGLGSGNFLPLDWTWVDGKLIVTHVLDPGVTTVQPGDEVRSIDGQPVTTLSSAFAKRISAATSQWRQTRVAQRLLEVPDSQSSQLSLVRDGRIVEASVTIERDRQTWSSGLARPGMPPISELEPGVAYVDLSRVSAEDIRAWMNRLAGAKTVILDDRDNPTVDATDLLEHLSDHHLHSAFLDIPIITEPDGRGETFDSSSTWDIAPTSPRFRGQLVMLVGGATISYGETFAGVFETERLGPIVGAPTAGTNGDVNYLYLPGDYVIRFTGLRFRKRDGSPHHGVGIRPTHVVMPTIAGIKAGRDEMLEAAVRAGSSATHSAKGQDGR